MIQQLINSVGFQPASDRSQKGAAELTVAEVPQQIKGDSSYHLKFYMNLHVKRSWKPQNRGISMGFHSYAAHLPTEICV